ncbi:MULTISPECIES: hypothetical protein [Winogradskyella]|uniref:hypothetical protein n=1 Tax=Winogradskyella TaxID=286104 RepID=UPI0015CD0D50|nr:MULTISPECIES: hypothetical protein [Winogradskyella]QXP78484.1 hypothetical protein H0I32_14880 [Winogradskyella sp. HaHa_3_26]
MELTSKNIENTKEDWNSLGSKYASDVNKMVAFGETNGWENWKGEEPKDERDHLAGMVYQLLKEANKNNTVAQFRIDFPPAHTPFVQFMKDKGQSVEQLHFIDHQKIVFLTGTAYQKRQAYLLKDSETLELDSSISAIGKSKQNHVFAIAANNTIVTTQGWEGEIIATFTLDKAKNIGITELIPFNDGLKVLLVSSDGIYIISNAIENLIHPLPDPEDDEWEPYLDMENATLSNDNKYIVVGDQCYDHRILDQNGTEIGEIGPQSDYPDFCLFSKDDKQLITNSCHFYNGITIGVDTSSLKNLSIPAYDGSEDCTTIDSEMRVYCGVSTSEFYILGDAFGYIRAVDTKGNCIWRYFLGSTITGITISEDEKTLWVGSASGMLHKLQLEKGLRDKHTIGTGNHYEEFRLVLWKDEPIMKW